MLLTSNKNLLLFPVVEVLGFFCISNVKETRSRCIELWRELIGHLFNVPKFLGHCDFAVRLAMEVRWVLVRL